jgi:hypothetical protein
VGERLRWARSLADVPADDRSPHLKLIPIQCLFCRTRFLVLADFPLDCA